MPALGSPYASTRKSSLPLKLVVYFAVLLLLPTLLLAALRTAVVDSEGNVGQYTSIAVDSNGRSHMSYYDATRHDLKYATLDPGGRIIDVVDSVGDVGQYSAIAVDRNGLPHISYYDATNKDLKYAVKRNGRWTVQKVDTAGDVGRYTSIAVDTLGNPHISYYDQGNGYLKLAYLDGGWQVERCCQAQLIEGPSTSGRATSIKLEHMAQKPLVLFFEAASKTLKLAIFDRTLHQWGVENIRNASFMLQDVSLTLDTGNQPHVSFSEVTSAGETVQYGMKNCLASGCITQVTPSQPTGQGTWSFEQVPSSAVAAEFTSLALDGQNAPHVSYYDVAYGLRHAVKSGGAWSLETVDPALNTGLYSAIGLDASNNSHFSYYDQTLGNLKYAGPGLPGRLDVWIKDCPRDDAQVPSTAACPQFLSSPDITTGRTSGISGPRGQATLTAQVRNRSFLAARDVSVKFYLWYADSHARGDIASYAKLLGERHIALPPNTVGAVSILWTPPDPLLRVGTARCIGVVLDSVDDPRIQPSVTPDKDNNFAVKCSGGLP